MRVGLYDRLEYLFCYPGYKTFEFWRIYVGALERSEHVLLLVQERRHTIIVNVFPLPV